MEMVRQHAQGSVVENDAIPNEHNEAVMHEASGSILFGIQHMAQQGGLDQILSGLKNGTADKQMESNFAQNIASKFGIGNQQAAQVAGALIPTVLSQLTSKLQNGNFNLQDILNQFGGGTSGGGIMNNISNLGKQFGLDKDGDGDVDLGDVMKMFGK